MSQSCAAAAVAAAAAAALKPLAGTRVTGTVLASGPGMPHNGAHTHFISVPSLRPGNLNRSSLSNTTSAPCPLRLGPALRDPGRSPGIISSYEQ